MRLRHSMRTAAWCMLGREYLQHAVACQGSQHGALTAKLRPT